VLAARDLRVVRGGATLVEVASLALMGGATHVLLGPNGAGKSTLLRALNGLVQAEGELVFEGRAVADATARLDLRRRTAAVLQKPYLLATSVRGNVEAGLRLRGVRGTERRERAAAALDLLGITHLGDRSPAKLSGGEAQRVSLARALAVDPRVLFLDEPMASLDPPTRRTLLADLLDIFAGRSTAVAWVTHDKEEAFAVGDSVSFLDGGRVLQTGPCREVFNRPAAPAIADFLGVETWLEGEVVRSTSGEPSRFLIDGGGSFFCGDAPGGPAVACVHPEDVILFDQAPAARSTSLRNVLRADVTAIREAGRLRYVAVGCDGFVLTAVITQAACEELGLRVGSAVYAAFKASAVQVMSKVMHRDDQGTSADHRRP
jgi:tungstate transport system ATP-binding protein